MQILWFIGFGLLGCIVLVAGMVYNAPVMKEDERGNLIEVKEDEEHKEFCDRRV